MKTTIKFDFEFQWGSSKIGNESTSHKIKGITITTIFFSIRSNFSQRAWGPSKVTAVHLYRNLQKVHKYNTPSIYNSLRFNNRFPRRKVSKYYLVVNIKKRIQNKIKSLLSGAIVEHKKKVQQYPIQTPLQIQNNFYRNEFLGYFRTLIS